MVHVLIEKVLDLAFFILLVLLFGILFCLQVTFYYLRICQIIFFFLLPILYETFGRYFTDLLEGK